MGSGNHLQLNMRRALLSVATTAQTALAASGFALSILFLLFLGINLCWEVSSLAHDSVARGMSTCRIIALEERPEGSLPRSFALHHCLACTSY